MRARFMPRRNHRRARAGDRTGHEAYGRHPAAEPRTAGKIENAAWLTDDTLLIVVANWFLGEASGEATLSIDGVSLALDTRCIPVVWKPGVGEESEESPVGTLMTAQLREGT